MNNFLFKPWQHNRSKYLLTPPARKRQLPYYFYLAVLVVPFFALRYSYHGFTKDILPNSQAVLNDKQRLLTKRRAFDTLVMAHKDTRALDKCNNASLF